MEPHAVFSFTGGPILGPAPQTFLPPPQDHPTIILGVDEIILGVDGIILVVDDFGYHLEIILVALKAKSAAAARHHKGLSPSSNGVSCDESLEMLELDVPCASNSHEHVEPTMPSTCSQGVVASVDQG